MVRPYNGEDRMLSHEPSPTTRVSDWELGVAAVLILVAVVLTAILVPTFA
jgi:hypothetical protein